MFVHEQTNQVVAGDTAFYIFTSGTTGVPKAALFTNVKVVAGSTNITMAGYRLTSEDCMYNCLPLYHSTGLILGLCASIKVGASTFIKRKFSAENLRLIKVEAPTLIEAHRPSIRPVE